jgi:hypothetical protein
LDPVIYRSMIIQLDWNLLGKSDFYFLRYSW